MYLRVNGTEIFFDVEGSGLKEVDGRLMERPTIIALHGGLGFDHSYLRDGLGRLQDIAQIIYVDQRGQGRSGRPPLETATLEQMADDVAALAQHIGIARPFIFGHSAGGFVALHVALRHPELPAGLILSGSSPSVAPVHEDVDDRSPSLADRASPEALAAAAKVFSGDITTETISEFFTKVGPYYAGPQNMELTSRLMRPMSLDIDMVRHFMTHLAPGYDLTSQLERIKTAVLLLVGTYDWVCPPRASRAIARHIARASLVEFEKSGHFLFSEEPVAFHRVVEDFLQDQRQ